MPDGKIIFFTLLELDPDDMIIDGHERKMYQILNMIPAEHKFAMGNGMEALLDLYEKANIPLAFDPNRKSLV
jgi:hypothetical protein